MHRRKEKELDLAFFGCFFSQGTLASFSESEAKTIINLFKLLRNYMSEIKLAHAGSLRAGSYILIDGAPCIVKDTQTSRPGKHGHAKVRIKATDMFTGSTKEIVKPGHDNVEVPIIYKKNGQLLSITGDNMEIMDMETFETLAASLAMADEEVRDKLEAGQTVLFWQVTGKIVVKQIVQGAE